ncbi:hypothetical protein FQA39_LY07067 [Lamprigera yunnana]|nr:hypothetical protein FQA39_LY07067 [Lamprigera yunnana]
MAPPDGGWGWVIMFAFIVANHDWFLFIPVNQNFGLIFKDTFKTMEMSGASVTSIISTNMATASLIGLATGPLLKKFKIRTVSIGGGILFVVGLISTVFAKSFLEFLIFYGIINGIGLGILRLTFALSLNLYFLKRRNKVAGISLALRSLGSIVMPQTVVALLTIYGAKSTLLLIAGAALHIICTSLLLHPVEWHTKKTIARAEDGTELANLLPEEAESIVDVPVEIDKSLNKFKRTFTKIVDDLFGLSLFGNPSFTILVIGMQFSVFSDASFSTMFALILSDLNFKNSQIAAFISISYISNITVRILIPFVGDYLKRSSKFMYLLSVVLVICGRFGVLHFSKPETFMFIAIIWGAAKGMRTVYWIVILADNVPPEKLSAAESLQMVLNGICMIIGGSLLGLIKDATGSYANFVYALNAISFVTFLLWTSEAIYRKLKNFKNLSVILNSSKKNESYCD